MIEYNKTIYIIMWIEAMLYILSFVKHIIELRI